MVRLVRVAVVAALVAAAVPAALAAQDAGGGITGKVVDSGTGEPLVGAEVYVRGTQLGSLTDLDGAFEIEGVPAGPQGLRVLYLGYAEKTVTGLEVPAGGAVTIEVSMVPEALLAEGVTVEVTAEEERGSVEGALAFQRSSTNVVNGISSQEIRRTPDSNAAEAVKRVSSTSLVDGRYVYVRGLGERYSTALLDNVALPTPEPEKRVVPLDLFPASMLESVFTVKTFTPDLPGDFAGGLVSIQTKDVPDEPFFRISTGAGWSSNLADEDLPDYRGGDLDWLGVDDGTRELPDEFPERLSITTPRDQVAALHSSFRSDFRTTLEEPGFGEASKSFGLSLGTPTRLLGRDAGFFLGGNYAYNANARTQKEFYPSLAADLFQYDFDSRIGTREVTWGGLAGLGIELSNDDRLSWKTLVTQAAEDEARLVSGPFDFSTSGFARISRLQFVERTLLSSQLQGEHKVGWIGDGRLEWEGAYGFALRDEPDTRQSFYVAQAPDGPFFFNETGDNGRFFSDLTDRLAQGSFKLSSRFGFLNGQDAVLDVGGLGALRTRDFSARRFAYENSSPAGRTLPPEQLFTADAIAAGDISFLERTEPNDEYEATEVMGAGFASLDVGVSNHLRVTGGLRVERNETELDSFDPATGSRLAGVSTDLRTTEPLPSLAVRWEPSESQVVHLSGTRTIVRPQFRELAPFRYETYLESTLGNPFLENGEIWNADLRWSLFPNLGEIVSIGAFYKRFNDPIEIVRIPTGGTNLGTPEPYNAPGARTYGVELELRQDLGNWTRGLNGLGMSANVAFADSKVEQDRPVKVFTGGSASSGPTLLEPEVFTNAERPMVNQSPFLVNASLWWTGSATGTTATLLYNGIGERLAQVGVQGFDDIYELQRHSLDLTVEQPLGDALSAKVALQNLTDAPYEFRLGQDTTRKYEIGRQVSFTAAYTF
jgi:outer membrane receptor protein involved in Fe transport